MKKRNRVLEILACTALAAVVFLAYMFTAQDNGKFEIRDLEGDRAHLADFAFEGIAGDETGQVHYIWQNGELKTDYYPGNMEQVDDILYQRKQGKNIINQYFSRLDNTLYSSPDLETAPSEGASVQTFDKLEDLPEELRAEVEQDIQGRGNYELKAAVTDVIDVYAEVNDYEKQRTTRFFTGLQLTGEEYYFTEVEYDRGSTRINNRDSIRNLGISAVDMEDAWYTILNTDETCEGKVHLYRIPKDSMIAYSDRPQEVWDDLYSDATYGEAEVIKTFPVNADDRIISLEKAGKDRMLLAVTEKDALVLELYDLEGNLIQRLDAGVPNASAYELDGVQMLQRDDQLVLWFDLMLRIDEENDAETFHYEIQGTKYFVVEDDEIRALQAKNNLDYIDVKDGKLLTIEPFGPKDHLATEFYGYWYVGFDLSVTNIESGELLYHGRLKTDYEEDYNKLLSAINIGQQAEPINERKGNLDWQKMSEMNDAQRNVVRVLPMEGMWYNPTWREGYDWGYIDGDYYYH